MAFIFTYEGNTYQAHALDEEDLAWIAEAGQALRQIVEDREVMALVYLCDEYKLHSDASEDSAAVVTVPSGQMVEILDVTVDEDGQVWEKVSTDMSGTDYIGYVRRDYLACSDERFLEWEEYYGMNPGGAAMLAADGQGNYADIEQFPAGYQPALTALVEAVLEAAVALTVAAVPEAAAARIVEAAPEAVVVPTAAEAPAET